MKKTMLRIVGTTCAVLSTEAENSSASQKGSKFKQKKEPGT